MTPDQLAHALTEERKRLGVTQQTVADRMGKHISFVQAIEYHPTVNRKLGTYIAYAEALGVKLEFALS